MPLRRRRSTHYRTDSRRHGAGGRRIGFSDIRRRGLRDFELGAECRSHGHIYPNLKIFHDPSSIIGTAPCCSDIAPWPWPIPPARPSNSPSWSMPTTDGPGLCPGAADAGPALRPGQGAGEPRRRFSCVPGQANAELDRAIGGTRNQAELITLHHQLHESELKDLNAFYQSPLGKRCWRDAAPDCESPN